MQTEPVSAAAPAPGGSERGGLPLCLAEYLQDNLTARSVFDN